MPRKKGIGKPKQKMTNNKNHHVPDNNVPSSNGRKSKVGPAPQVGNGKNKSVDAAQPMEVDMKVEFYDHGMRIRLQSATAPQLDTFTTDDQVARLASCANTTTVVAPSAVATACTTNVARTQPTETEDTPTPSMPTNQQAARFQNAALLFDGVDVPPINENAFKFLAEASNNAAPRSNVAE
jgi:hypothetical protein